MNDDGKGPSGTDEQYQHPLDLIEKWPRKVANPDCLSVEVWTVLGEEGIS